MLNPMMDPMGQREPTLDTALANTWSLRPFLYCQIPMKLFKHEKKKKLLGEKQGGRHPIDSNKHVGFISPGKQPK